MTNAEKFKSVEERVKAFYAFCDSYGLKCDGCPVISQCPDRYNPKAAFAWLELEAKNEKPLPCPFCGGKCKAQDGRIYCERPGCFIGPMYKNNSEAVSAYNKVARKCMDGK